MSEQLSEICDFLHCDTPKAWIEVALDNLPVLLIDHAHCEKKAASTAMNLMFRYVDRPDLLNKMSRLAREELIHFEQVLALMERRGVVYRHLSQARYAGALREEVRTSEPGRLVDMLIIGAIIEARSCERFARLAPYLDNVDAELGKYYRSLLKSEGRHYQDYLSLAEAYTEQPIQDRLNRLLEKEAALISSPDTDFRFHSGVPA